MKISHNAKQPDLERKVENAYIHFVVCQNKIEILRQNEDDFKEE
jgi:hypothetical protein